MSICSITTWVLIMYLGAGFGFYRHVRNEQYRNDGFGRNRGTDTSYVSISITVSNSCVGQNLGFHQPIIFSFEKFIRTNVRLAIDKILKLRINFRLNN